MKKVISGLFAVAIGTASLVHADQCGSCDPCTQYCDPCGDMCCGSFEVGAEALYFQPSQCDLNYAIEDPRAFVPGQSGTAASLPNGRAQGVKPSYDWGFRVMVGYVFDGGCSDVQVEYMYFHPSTTKHTHDVGTNGVWATYGQPRYISEPVFNPIASASLTGEQLVVDGHGRASWNFDSVDVTFGSRSMKGCDMWVRAFVGLHWANIEHKFATELQGTIRPGQASGTGADDAVNFAYGARNRRSVWGVGPKFGVDARYHIACGFGIGAKLAVGLIAGESDGRMTQTVVQDSVVADPAPLNPIAISETLDVSYAHRTVVIPVIQARLGLNYTFCCGDCFTLMGEVGYEFISYINAVGESVFNDVGATQSQACYSFNMQGLYIMGRITF